MHVTFHVNFLRLARLLPIYRGVARIKRGEIAFADSFRELFSLTIDNSSQLTFDSFQRIYSLLCNIVSPKELRSCCKRSRAIKVDKRASHPFNGSDVN